MIFGLTCLGSFCTAQEVWYTYNLDSAIEVDLPGEVYGYDTVSRGLKIEMIYSNHSGATYLAQRIDLAESSLYNKGDMPYDSTTLEKYYSGVLKGLKKTHNAKVDSRQTLIDQGLIVLEAELLSKDGIDKNFYRCYLMGSFLYAFNYSYSGSLNKTDSNQFFNSISIDKKRKQSQFIGTSKAFKIGELLGETITYGLLIVVLIWAIRKRASSPKKKTD